MRVGVSMECEGARFSLEVGSGDGTSALSGHRRGRGAKRRPRTLKGIGEDLGISASAASSALLGLSGVGEELHNKVRRHARKVGYGPNFAGAALSTDRFHTPAFVLPVTPYPTMLEMGMLERFMGGAASRCRRIEVVSESYLAQSGITVLDELRNTRCDGALTFYLRLNEPILDASRLAFPVVVVNRAVEGMLADVMWTDDEGGAYAAVTHRIEFGHQPTAHLQSE